MSIGDQITSEAIKAFFTIIILSAGWFIGNRLSARISSEWAIRQKKREIGLGTAREFYKLYGEFFAVWKLWSYHKEQQIQADGRWALLERAAFAEGSLEAILVKLTSERSLTKSEIEVLARFRQGYQTLRESIRDDRYLGWSKDKHPEYVSFKRLAGLTSDIILKDAASKNRRQVQQPNPILDLTSSNWEGKWSPNEEEWRRLIEGLA